MRLRVLDSKQLSNGRTWFLCSGSLLDYLLSLKENFHQFAIQRKIVRNQYLDTLLNTIESKEPIPIITLTYSNEMEIDNNLDHVDFDFNDIEILDGLQRTFRLWAHMKLADEFKSMDNPTPREFAKHIKSNDEYSMFYDLGIINYSYLIGLVENNRIENIIDNFQSFDIYFVMWCNIDSDEVIDKMLTLNAGQKSVSRIHQYELIFLHFLEKMEEVLPEGVEVFRERDFDFTSVKRGKRAPGQYTFYSIVVSLMSFLTGKPKRVNIDDFNIFNSSSSDEPDSRLTKAVFSEYFIESFIRKLYMLDILLEDSEGDEGLKWIVKDTTLSGLFSAIGRFSDIQRYAYFDDSINEIAHNLNSRLEECIDKVEFIVANNQLNLTEFNEAYNNLSSRNINIGHYVRSIISDYFLMFFQTNEIPSWSVLFKINSSKDD